MPQGGVPKYTAAGGATTDISMYRLEQQAQQKVSVRVPVQISFVFGEPHYTQTCLICR